MDIRKEEPVIKGNKDGLVVLLDGYQPVQPHLQGIKDRIGSAENFFKNAKASLQIKNQPLDEEEVKAVRDLLKEWNITVEKVSYLDEGKSEGEVNEKEQVKKSGDSEKETDLLAQEIHQMLDYEKTIQRDVKRTQGREKKRKQPKDLETSLLRKTLRSGQHVKYDGNVVVMGDVNPGAEVTAAGDILVFGSFRGVGHAGASGSEQAVVAALRLLPTQLRIANYISRAPDERSEKPNRPEMALIKNGRIEIETFSLRG